MCDSYCPPLTQDDVNEARARGTAPEWLIDALQDAVDRRKRGEEVLLALTAQQGGSGTITIPIRSNRG